MRLRGAVLMPAPFPRLLTHEAEQAALRQVLAHASEPYENLEGLEKDLTLALAFCEAGAWGVGDILRTVLKRLAAQPAAAEDVPALETNSVNAGGRY
jgi:hypothetical protein